MRRLLATVTNSPYGFGGVSAWIERITLAMPEYGWHVTTVTHAIDSEHLADWKANHPGIVLKPIFGKFARLNQIETELENYLDQERPGVILVNSSFWMLPVIQRRKGRGEDVRVIGMCHADENGYYSWLNDYRDAWDHVISVSKTCARRLFEFGFPPEKTSLLRYGVPCPSPVPERQFTGPIRLVYVGRLVEHQKRVFDLVKLVHALNARHVDYRLDVFGSGEDEADLLQKIRALDGHWRTVFHGWVPTAELSQRAWQDAHVFVLLSEYEGLSISMLDAMGHGVVPIVSRVASGVDEVVQEGRTGFTFPVGDMERAAEMIASLDHDRLHLKEMSRQGKSLIQGEYSIDANARRLAGILDMVQGKPPQMTPAQYKGITSTPLARLIPGWAIVQARRQLKRGNPINEGYTTFR